LGYRHAAIAVVRGTDRDDSDLAAQRELAEVSEEGTHLSKLRRNRQAATRDAWRAVEELADSVTPTTSLTPTLISSEFESLPWEVLE
jgi:hypothetical protein